MRLLQGLAAAVYTATHDDGSVNLDIIPTYAARLAESGVRGVFVGGATGEGLSFTAAERIAVAETWCTAARTHGLMSIVHVGAACQKEAVMLAAAVPEADAVAAMAAPFTPPESVEDLRDFLAPIAAAAGDRPFLFYDNPARTSVDFHPGRVIETLTAGIPSFAGVKLTRSDLEATEAAIEACGERAQVLFACDEMLLFALQLGIEGAIGASYNHSGSLFHRMMAAQAAGDMTTATAEHDRAVVMIDVLHEHGIVRSGKAVMRLVGVECGPPRPPLSVLPESTFMEVSNALSALGLPDLVPDRTRT